MKIRAWITLAAMCLVFAGCSKKTHVSDNPDVTRPSDTSGSKDHSASDDTKGKGSNTPVTDITPTFIYTPVYFDYDDATLSDQARTILAATGAHLNKSPEKVTIEGHCDERGSV